MKPWIKRIAILLIIILAGLISFAGYKRFPPELQYDQVNRFIVQELQYKQALDLDLRTKIANHLTLTNLTAPFISQFRKPTGLDTINLLVKIPSMVMLTLTLIIWLGILKEIKISFGARILFALFFIFSPLFILYSKYIPLNAAYLMYISSSIYFLLKTVNSTKLNYKFITYLILSIISSIAAFYTHVMAIVVVFVFYLFFFIIIPSPKFAQKFKAIKHKNTGFITYLVVTLGTLLLILGVGVLSISTGQSISARSGHSILTDLQQSDLPTNIVTISKRIFSYTDPRFLALGKPQFIKEDAIDFQEFLNPDESEWQITNIGPFGPLAMLIYLLTPLLFFLPKSNKQANKLLVVLFVTYIITVPFSSYSNPSIARNLPTLMFVPLLLVIAFDQLLKSYKKGVERKFIILAAILLLIGNIAVVVNKMYTSQYYSTESHKYETGTIDICKEILEEDDLSDLRIYLNNTKWSSSRFLQIYLGPEIINRIVSYDDPQYIKQSINPYENNVIITKSKDDLDLLAEDFDLSVSNYKYSPLHFAQIRSDNQELKPRVFSVENTTYRIEDKSYERKTEFDTVFPQIHNLSSLYEGQIFTNRQEDSDVIEQNILTNANFEISQDDLLIKTQFLNEIRSQKINLLEDVIKEADIDLSQNVETLGDDSFSFTSKDDLSQMYIHIPNTSHNDYLLRYNLENKSGEKPIVAVNDLNNRKHIKPLQINNTDYLINSSKDIRLVITFNNVPTKDVDIPTKNTISNIRLLPLENTDLQNKYYRNNNPSENPKLIKLASSDNGFLLPRSCSSQTIIFNEPYNPRLRPHIDGKLIDKKTELINGYINGWTFSKDQICGKEEISFKIIDIL